jgi:hypothetical protein
MTYTGVQVTIDPDGRIKYPKDYMTEVPLDIAAAGLGDGPASEVTDAMVAKARAALREHSEGILDVYDGDMRAALEAAFGDSWAMGLQLIEALDLFKGAKRYVPASVADWHAREEAFRRYVKDSTGADP